MFLYYFDKYISNLNNINFIIFIFIYLLLFFILLFLIKQKQLKNNLYNFIKNYIFYIGLNDVNCFYFKFILTILIIIIMICIIKNIKKQSYNINKLLFLLIHIITIILIFDIFLKNIFFNKKEKLFTYIWIPKGWSFNKIITKNNKFFYLKIFSFLNLNNFFLYYNKFGTSIKFLSNFIYKKFKFFNLKINKPIFYTDIMINQFSFNNLYSSLNLNMYYFDNHNLKNVFIKTYIGDVIYLSIINKKLFKNKVLEIINVKEFNFKVNNKFWNRLFNIKNLGPVLKYNIYNIFNNNIIKFNTYINCIKENNINYNLLFFKINNFKNYKFYKILLDNFYSVKQNLILNFVLLNKHVRMLIINKLIDKIFLKKFYQLKNFLQFKYFNYFNKCIGLKYNKSYIIYNKFFNKLTNLNYKYNLNLNNKKKRINFFIYYIILKSLKLFNKSYNKKLKLNNSELFFLKNLSDFLTLNNFNKNFFYLKVNLFKKKFSNLLSVNNSNNKFFTILILFIFTISILLNIFFKFFYV